MLLRFYLIIISCVFMAASTAHAKNYYVKNQAQYIEIAKKLKAGDKVILANGEWRNFEIKFSGKGTKSKPITLTSEKAGKVFITGQSNLRIGGTHMIVAGLVFKNGFSPTGEVISFRTSKDNLASNSRVTQVVIDHFNKPDRFDNDYWVGMYGKNNRFDHNHLAGKSNKGVTFAVRLNSKQSQNNNHRIDHNYFGPRPVLGSNGGETLRIGTSKYAEFNSNTIVENNYFDRCDGEVEIISSKSGANIIRGNVFFESSGTLTLRHGDGNLVENNIFFGNGKDHTGGIRVINQRQIIRNNYMEGLRGTGFASALTVMNGVPNSPANRYVQVKDALIENNSVVNSSRITFNAGADDERSAPPIDSRFSNNLLSGDGGELFVKIQDDINGVAFDKNIIFDGNTQYPVTGIVERSMKLLRAKNGLLYPENSNAGASRNLTPVTRDQVGVSWYAKPSKTDRFNVGNTIPVAPGEDSLTNAFAIAKEGDRLLLSAGEYIVNKTLALDKSITIEALGDEVAKIHFTRPSLVEVKEGGSIKLVNISIDGELAPDNVGNSVIRTTNYPVQSNFLIEMDRVNITNLDVNKFFHVIALGKSTFADRISIKDSNFKNISGSILNASSETEDYGQYNAEYVDISSSQFIDVGGIAFDIYRGGRDESTFGPHFSLANSKFNNVGNSSNNASGFSLILHGAQYSVISGNRFDNSAPFKIAHTVGRPQTHITDNIFLNTAKPSLEELNYQGKHRATLSDNMFKDEVKP